MRFLMACRLFSSFFGIILFLSHFGAPNLSAKSFPLEEFLKRVEDSNRDFLSSDLRETSFLQRSKEASLQFQPYLFGGYQYQNSIESGFFSFLGENDRQKNQFFSLGIAKDWSFGTTTRFTNIFNRYDFESAGPLAGVTWQNQIELKLEQDLWRNFLGRERWNQEKSFRLSYEAQSKQESFSKKLKLAEAENLYWSYALAQETKTSVENSLKRARGILDWNKKRFDLKLIDQGDLLQSEARVLSLQQALIDAIRNEENTRRQMAIMMASEPDTDAPSEWELNELELELQNIQLPENWEIRQREDLMALRARTDSIAASSTALKSSLDPRVKLSAIYRGDSKSSGFSDSLGDAWGNDFREYQVGVQLEIPLGIRRNLELRSSAEREAQAQELQYEQVLRELENRFVVLKTEVEDLKNKIDLGRKRKSTEARKLANEEKRFQQGRSSSFQVLSFQEDLAQAELELLRLYASLRAQLVELGLFMKGFSESGEYVK